MKLCISTLACPAWPLGQIVDCVRECRIEGIDFRGLGDEIDITKLPAFGEGVDATVAFLRENQIELPCFNTSIVLVAPNPELWQKYLDECHRYAWLAHKTGTKFIRIFGGVVPKEMSREEARSMAQRHLRQLVKICRPACQVLLETHDHWTTSAEVLELLHEFDPKDAGVLWDIEHPHLRGEDPMDTVARMKKFIKHVHWKDSKPSAEKRLPTVLGQGDLPLAKCVQALKSIGYDNWICLETEKRWHAAAPEPEQSIPQFAEHLRAMW